MGFPLHQGTVETGLVTCHWHHARFDLASRAARSTRSPTTPRGFDVDHRRRRRARRRARHDGDPRAAPPGAGCAQGLEDGPHARDREVGARAARGRRAARRHRPGRARLRHALPRRRVGAPGLTVLVAMANLLPHLDAGRPARSRSSTGSRSCRGDTRNHPPRFPPRPARRRRRSATVSASGTAASSRPGRPTPPSARSPPRSRRATPDDVEGDDVRRGHRPRLRRRWPHHRLHEQGVRGTRLRRRDAAAGTVLPTLVQQTAGAVAVGGGRRVAPPARPRRAGRSAPTSDCRTRWREAEAVRGRLTDQDVADLGWRAARRRSRRGRRRAARRDRRAAPPPSSSDARSRSPPRSASRGSTRRTTSATGTSCTTRSPPPTGCTRRCAATRRPSCSAAWCTARCACTSTASSTCPRHACPRPTRATSPTSPRAGTIQGGVERGRRDRLRLPQRTAVTRRR